MALSLVRVVVAIVLVAVAGYAAAESPPSGTAIAVVQQASIDSQTGQRLLKPEAPVFNGDHIVTGPGGSAQVKFRDDTKLVVGPNSVMVIDAFIFNADDTARKISINAVRGAFRFITGKSSKDAYSITTPTATIGVRGSEFDISVESEGTTRVADFEGSTRICHRQANGAAPDTAGNCVDVTEPCTLSVVRPTESGVVKLKNSDTEYRNRQLKYYFPYVRDQAGLHSDFRVNLTACHFAAVVVPGSGSPPPGGALLPPPAVIPPPPPSVPSDPTFRTPTPPSPTYNHSRPSFSHGPAFR